MSLFLRILGQLFLILLGYAGASLAASAFIHLMLLGSTGVEADAAPALLMGSILFSIPFIALFVAYFAFMPAAVAIGIGEVLGARDWLFYAIAGAVVGACVVALFWVWTPPSIELDAELVPPRDPMMENPYVLFSLVGAGILGGVAYWAIAGRLAGGWRAEPPRALPPR